MSPDVTDEIHALQETIEELREQLQGIGSRHVLFAALMLELETCEAELQEIRRRHLRW
jgi:prefoldin subunit 5